MENEPPVDVQPEHIPIPDEIPNFPIHEATEEPDVPDIADVEPQIDDYDTGDYDFLNSTSFDDYYDYDTDFPVTEEPSFPETTFAETLSTESYTETVYTTHTYLNQTEYAYDLLSSTVPSYENYTIAVSNGTRNHTGWTTNPERAPYGYFWLVLGLFGAAINLLVIFMAVRLLRKSRTHKPSHIFILSYTCADFIFCIFNAPLFFCLHSVAENCNVRWAEPIKHIARWIAGISGNYSLMLITVDKLLYMVQPLRYSCYMNLPRATLIAAAIWLFATIVATCNFVLSHLHTTWYWMVEKCITLMLPIGVSIVISVCLLVLVVGIHQNGSVSVYPRARQPSWKKRSRTVVFIFATTFWTVLCLLPQMVVWGVASRTENWFNASWWNQHIYFSTRVLVYIDHVGNPLITIFVNVFYRNLFMKLVKSRGRKQNVDVDSESSRSNNNINNVALNETGCQTHV